MKEKATHLLSVWCYSWECVAQEFGGLVQRKEKNPFTWHYRINIYLALIPSILKVRLIMKQSDLSLLKWLFLSCATLGGGSALIGSNIAELGRGLPPLAPSSCSDSILCISLEDKHTSYHPLLKKTLQDLTVAEKGRRRLPEGASEVGELGSQVRLKGPAVGHQRVHCGWAELGFGESDPRLQLADHLAVLQPKEWLLGHWEDLPHAHACTITPLVLLLLFWRYIQMLLTKHPNIACCGEASEVDGFRRHPFDR